MWQLYYVKTNQQFSLLKIQFSMKEPNIFILNFMQSKELKKNEKSNLCTSVQMKQLIDILTRSLLKNDFETLRTKLNVKWWEDDCNTFVFMLEELSR